MNRASAAKGEHRAAATVIVLWIAACGGILAWFATHKREDKPSPEEFFDGATAVTVWNTGPMLAAFLVTTGVAIVALILIYVWGRDTVAPTTDRVDPSPYPPEPDV